jgi:hypothetical protein
MATKKSYRFTGKEGKIMPETLLKKWIQQHQDLQETRAHFFGKEIIMKFLNQPGCVGIRIHYAIDDNGKKQLILIGTNEKGQDLWPSSAGGKLKGGGGDGGGDQSMPCPPFCP